MQTVVCATSDTAAIRPGSVSAIGLFDVIEHQPNDVEFLDGMAAHLCEAGLVYATVPAYQWLWSSADVKAGHFRRYTRSALGQAFDHAGFDVVFVSHIFRWLPLPMWLFRCLPERIGLRARSAERSDTGTEHQTDGSSRLRKIIDRVLASESVRITGGRPLAFGASILVVARRRQFNSDS